MTADIANMWWVLILLGFVGGIISAALGVGSGIVFVPVLVMVFLLPQKAAQGTALAVMVPMALLGAYRYWRNPDIDVSMNVVALLSLGSLLGVLIGAEIASQMPAHWLRKAFAVLMVVAAVRMFSMPPRPPGSPPTESKTPAATEIAEEADNAPD